MPLPVRNVEPVYISRGVSSQLVSVANPLEASINGTLANLIHQLSSISHHAKELFADLIQIGSEIANRANTLQERIDTLTVRVIRLDASQEELCMQESMKTKLRGQGLLPLQQQVVSRHTIPPPLKMTYDNCDKPPALHKLNVYRDDGKDGLLLYTNPSCFFDSWKQQMFHDTEKALKMSANLGSKSNKFAVIKNKNFLSIGRGFRPSQPPPPPPSGYNIEMLSPLPPPPDLEKNQPLSSSPTLDDKTNQVRNAMSEAQCNGMSEMLEAIRQGIELKKVCKMEDKDKAVSTNCDVAAILARRVAFEMSDNDSVSIDSADNSEDWE